jgi:predicted nucleotidyltransferase
LATALEDLLSRTVSFLEREGIDYMVIGGFALPSYGAIRSTVDLDMAVKITDSREFGSFVELAKKSGFKPGVASFSNPVNTFVDGKTGLEVEFWLRPDGIEWDWETLRRRRKVKIGSVDVMLISPEDFIVTKLSRPDRGVQDEMDVKGVLTRLGGSIDGNYLERRAVNAGVLSLLRAIEKAR